MDYPELKGLGLILFVVAAIIGTAIFEFILWLASHITIILS